MRDSSHEGSSHERRQSREAAAMRGSSDERQQSRGAAVTGDSQEEKSARQRSSCALRFVALLICTRG